MTGIKYIIRHIVQTTYIITVAFSWDPIEHRIAVVIYFYVIYLAREIRRYRIRRGMRPEQYQRIRRRKCGAGISSLADTIYSDTR